MDITELMRISNREIGELTINEAIALAHGILGQTHEKTNSHGWLPQKWYVKSKVCCGQELGWVEAEGGPLSAIFRATCSECGEAHITTGSPAK